MQELEYQDFYSDYSYMSVEELRKTGLKQKLLWQSEDEYYLWRNGYVFYDGDAEIALTEDNSIDFDNLDPSINLVILADEGKRSSDGMILNVVPVVYCRAKKLIKGMNKETTLGDLFDMEHGPEILVYGYGDVYVDIWKSLGDNFGNIFSYDPVSDIIYYDGENIDQPVPGLDTEELHQFVISQGWNTWDTDMELQDRWNKMKAAEPVIEDYLREQKLNGEVFVHVNDYIDF